MKLLSWLDEFLYLFLIQIALILLTGIDFLMHETLYHYGLHFSINWAVPYWIILTGVFWAIALIGVSAYHIDREKFTKLKSIGIFITILAEYHGGWLDTLWFIIDKLRYGTWGKAFQNWVWHPYSSWFGYWDLNMNLILNFMVFIFLILLWYFIKQRD